MSSSLDTDQSPFSARRDKILIAASRVNSQFAEQRTTATDTAVF